MAGRIIAQILLGGSVYVARAFVQAYQQALVNSARGGAQGGAAAARLRGRLTAEEASAILGVKKDAGLKDIYTKYDHLFKANDPAKGGSIYLQAKIHNAKMELEKQAVGRGEQPRPPPESPPSSGAAADPSS